MPSQSTATPPPCVVITTYSRPDGLSLLLDDIERDRPDEGLDVHVYDDATPAPDPKLEARLDAHGWTLRRAGVNHGKRDWWRWWNTILEEARHRPAPVYYVLQDDMRLCERFFERSLELWSSIDDPQKASLYLHLSAGRAELGGRCWTPVSATRTGRVVHSGWVDCAAFMCDRRLFEGLAWRLHPIPARRWRGKEVVSSGVGQQISVRAQQAGLGLYRVERSLTVHDGGPSLMSAEARRRWSMNTVGFIDGDAAATARGRPRPHTFAALASVPAREHGLQRVVKGLLPQVDALGVYLNAYERVPRFLEHEKIAVARSQESGDRGDAGKFFWAGTTNGYHLVCDDDLDYPEDYVGRLVDGIERHGRRAVVGFHGCLLQEVVADYHRSRRLLHYTRALAEDTSVHVLGTGVAGYHSSAVRVRSQDFVTPNLADIWMALLGQRQGVPFACLRHDAGWLSDLPGFREASIYVRARRRAAVPGAGPGPETLAVRGHGKWVLQELPGDRVRAEPASGTAARRALSPRSASKPHVEPERVLASVGAAGPQRMATLMLPVRDHITEAVQRSGTYYERDLLDAIRDRQAPGVFVDVGAHYGNHTTFFGLECVADRVIAIEPAPEAFAGLCDTIAANGLQSTVTAHRLAAHPSWRRVDLTPLPWQPRPGAFVQSNSGQVGVTSATGGGDAPAAPLDEILDGLDGVALIKVDAARLCAEILASGQRTLKRDRPLIAAEAGSEAERHALRALLSPLGFREVGRFGWTATWLWEPLR